MTSDHRVGDFAEEWLQCEANFCSEARRAPDHQTANRVTAFRAGQHAVADQEDRRTDVIAITR